MKSSSCDARAVRFPRRESGERVGRATDALSRAAEPLSRRASRVGLSTLRATRRISRTLATSRFCPTFKPFGALNDGAPPQCETGFLPGRPLAPTIRACSLSVDMPNEIAAMTAGSRPCLRFATVSVRACSSARPRTSRPPGSRCGARATCRSRRRRRSLSCSICRAQARASASGVW